MSKGFKKEVSQKLEAHRIEVVRLGRDQAKWWNERRRPEDTRIFCGWFWICGSNEGGPFPTPSSAYRDAYYKLILQREPPSALPKVVQFNRRRRA